jgi:N-formylglutamate deformylase
MTDEELVEAFERGTMAPRAFGHREHVRVAWLYLKRYEPADAERRMLDGLRAFAARAGKPSKFDAGLTHAWMGAIDAARRAEPPGVAFDDLVRARPALLDSSAVGARR